ncbi:MAG: tetratricopeptide repeat protein, partial [Proteobacteria bacterium]|nr:tetratricopeptide repeat protein [Pseudomonadota bacterium]
VDVLGVGTASGAPLPSADGRFVTDVQGSPQVARLDEPSLRELASAGGGRYAPISAADADLRALGVLTPRADAAVGKASADVLAWRDDGPWLVLILLPLAALAFRRGWLAAVLLVGMLALPTPPAQAAPQGAWQGWWTRADQRADRALRAGDAQDAAALAQTPAQRAAAAYLKGDYAAAADGWSHLNDADAAYNRGNALAQMGRYDQAISAWQAALKQQPGMTDAQANIDAVRKLLAQRKPPPQQGQHSAQQKEQGKDRGKDQQKSQAQGKQPDQQTAQGQHDDAQAQSKQASQSQQPQSQQQSQQQQAQQQQAQQQQAQEQAQQQHSSQRQQPSPRQNASSQQDASAQSAQPKPDAAAQARAQAAEKQALQQALASRGKDGKPPQSPVLAETTAQREQRQANQQIMQRVPDEPGALLKRKFWLEYQRRLQGDSP